MAFLKSKHIREKGGKKKKKSKTKPRHQPDSTFLFSPFLKTNNQTTIKTVITTIIKTVNTQRRRRRRQTSPSGQGVRLKGWFSRRSSSLPTTFFTRAEQDFWLSGVRAGSSFMTTRSGRAATPCEVSEPADSEAPRVRPTPARWGDGGGERTLQNGKKVLGAQVWSSRLQVGYKWPGRRKLWEGVDTSREFWRDAGGRFLERGATLVASSQSMSCTEPFWLVTLGCGSGRRMEGESKGAASRPKRLEAPGASWWPAGVGCAGRTGRRRGASARAHRLRVSRPASVPAGYYVPSWEW